MPVIIIVHEEPMPQYNGKQSTKTGAVDPPELDQEDARNDIYTCYGKVYERPCPVKVPGILDVDSERLKRRDIT